MDEALVPHAKRLRIGRSNFHLLSDIKSKESTLKLVYDVLRLTPFFKAFLVTTDVPEIYMQEFWATTTVEHKDSKKINEMYYPRFTKVIIHHFMSNDNWHYVRDDYMFSTIKLVSRHQNTQQFGALLPIELTNEDIRNSNLIKSPRLTTFVKGKQTATASKAKSLSALSEMKELVLYQGFPMYPLMSLRKNSLVNDDDDEDHEVERDDEKDDEEEEPRDEESFNPIPRTPEDFDDEGNGDEDLGLNVGREEGHDEEEEEDKLYRDVNINQGRGIQTTQEFEDSHVTLTSVNPDGMESIFETTSQMDAQTPTSVAPLPMFVPTMTLSTITTTSQAPTPPTTALSSLIQDLPNFGSLFGFNNRLGTLEANFSKFMQTNQFAGAVSAIPAKKENDKFLKIIDENMQKIIKEQVKEQVKALVEAYESDKIILDTYEETVTLKRRYDDDANKDEEPSVEPDRGSKRCREGKEPKSASTSESAIAKEPIQTTFQIEDPSHPEFNTGAEDQPIVQSSQHPEWFSQQQKPPTLDRDWNTTVPATHESIQTWQYPHNLLKPLPLIPNNRGRRVIPFDHFINNDLEYLRGGASRRKYTTSITKTKAADYGHIKWIKDLVPRTMWIEEPIGYDKHALWGVSHWGRKRQQFYGFAVNWESTHDVYSKRRIIAVVELKIVEWHNYKHLDWITVRRDNDKLYKFKEGDFKRLRIQDIEDMLLLLRRVEDLQLGVESYQKKLNLTKPDSYRSDLKSKEAYTAYSNPRGFIYQNKDKKNRLMRIDEFHKFSDGTLIDVRTALDDHIKGIRIKYLPQSIWRKRGLRPGRSLRA
uniref:Uncharacterized protein n=1 Tax=Tanacetum cinerariifolium TaxID=118510 RepID=A0A6L2LNR2_TANCI|nr:hypothetical protein [Tanacetum cinerariifolium]